MRIKRGLQKGGVEFIPTRVVGNPAVTRGLSLPVHRLQPLRFDEADSYGQMGDDFLPAGSPRRIGILWNAMLELSALQIAVLERLQADGFELVAFPLYANYVGVRKGNCAALLQPAGDGMKVFGEPCFLVAGNLSVRVRRGGQQWFVSKKNRLRATSERLAELDQFSTALAAVLRAAL